MSTPLRLHHVPHQHVEISTAAGALLWCYVYAPAAPGRESPRPYAHPVLSLAGDLLTNYRPNDHPWHHGLSLTIASVAGVNFWGGPTYHREGGYRWSDDHGAQVHRSWQLLSPERMEETLDWCEPPSGRVLLHERRVLETSATDTAWTLRWTSELLNVTGHDLSLGNYHSLGGLEGSHYTGLQFRGARDLLDEHGDKTMGLTADGGRAGEAAVHGAEAVGMDWSCQHDGSLRRTRIRFENLGGPLPWFVRAKLPLAVFAFHRERPHVLPAGGQLRLAHQLHFANA